LLVPFSNPLCFCTHKKISVLTGHRLMEACKDMERSERERVREGQKSICLIDTNLCVDYWCGLFNGSIASSD
jgi:hypothetical protein